MPTLDEAEIRRLRAAITPGEWARFQKTLTEADPLDESQPLGTASVECITDLVEEDGGRAVITIAPDVVSNADAEFIAAAPAIADAYLASLATEPTEDVREALARLISVAENFTDDEGTWALPEDIADAILARFTVTPKGEPGNATGATRRAMLRNRAEAAEAELVEAHTHFAIQEGRIRAAQDRASAYEARIAEALAALGPTDFGGHRVVEKARRILKGES